MRKPRKMKKHKSKKLFSNTARKTHSKNKQILSVRGGIRL